MVKKIVLWLMLIIVVGGAGYGLLWWQWPVINPRGSGNPTRTLSLQKYDFDSLRKRGGITSEIKDEGELKGVQLRRDYEIKFESNEISFISEGKKITGMMNVPMTPKSNKMPAVIMVRGYADKAGYYPGFGTWRVADKLAEAGFVTVSLDFLGYGGSDMESLDMLEARFEKVPAVLDLLESVKELPFVDPTKIGFWAHSNGGQIVLSVLEVTGENHPTVLWAPMTNPFPKSVLDTASDLDDGGKAVRSAIEAFTTNYDARRYAFENYYEWINSPVVIHQGTGDVWCKKEWQEAVVDSLKKTGKSAVLYTYTGDDHNLSKNWGEIVERDITFFKERFGLK